MHAVYVLRQLKYIKIVFGNKVRIKERKSESRFHLESSNDSNIAHYENMPIQIYTENFTTKQGKFSDKKFWYFFFIFLLKT